MPENPARCVEAASILGQSSEEGIALLTSFGYNVNEARPPAMLRHPGANAQRSHCEGKGATAVTHDNDKPGFVAEEPGHCFACYRLIRPGQIYI